MATGAGITTRGGALSLDHSVVSGNAGIGISMLEGGASVTLNHSTVADNTGAGIAVAGTTGYVTLTGSKVRGNTGGGIFLEDSTLRAANSSISSNSATWGGGIYAVDAYADLTNSAVSKNSASQGGGIFLDWPSGLTLAGSSRVTRNTAAVAGGGVSAPALEVMPTAVRLTGANRIKNNTPDNCYPRIGPLAACPKGG